jgi:hypothetical protein
LIPASDWRKRGVRGGGGKEEESEGKREGKRALMKLVLQQELPKILLDSFSHRFH